MSTPSLAWIKQTNVLNTNGTESLPSIARDASGNVYVSYFSDGTVSSGTNSGQEDIVVAKMDTNGNVVWIKQTAAMNTTGTDTLRTIGVDQSGNVYVAYQTTGTVSGGTYVGGVRDIVVFKMDTNGNLVWIKEQAIFNSTGLDQRDAIAVDLSGNVYVAYQTDGTQSGGTNSGADDITVFKMDTNGNMVWLKQMIVLNTTTTDASPGITVDINANVYVSYLTFGTVSSGTNKGDADIVVFKMDTNGNVIWIKQTDEMNTTIIDADPQITCDQFGNVIVTYWTNGTVSGGEFFGLEDVVVFKLDTDGNLVWITQNGIMNTSGDELLPSITCDAYGNSYVVYTTSATVSGGANEGGTDIVIVRIDPSGNIVWTIQESIANTAGDDSRPSVALDLNGNIFVTYYTTGTVSAGTFSGGASDIVVLKYAPSIPSSALIAVQGGPIDITNYISSKSFATDTDKANTTIEMRSAIKSNTFINDSYKTISQVAYINAMITKIGSSFTLPSAQFSSFSDTFGSTSPSLSAKPVQVFFPTFSGQTATADVSTASSSNYVHQEVPIGYSITLQNGSTLQLTNMGTYYKDVGNTSYTTGTVVTLGDKTYTFVGIGSLMMDVQNGQTVICLIEGTMILTPTGNVPIESLHNNDMIITGNKTTVPIVNIQKIVVVNANEINAPYVIEKEAFGSNCPPNQLTVSPRHAIQLQPDLWEIPKEAAKVNAKVYQNKDTFGKKVIYYHIALPNYEHDTMIANGQITESLNDEKVIESYNWNKILGGYVRTTKPFEKSKVQSA